MKDRQIAATITEPRIFLVSPILHCVSMTVLVYLRSSFGFGYLRPKSIFFACSWAFVLYVLYAWMDGNAWREHHAVLWFGMGAMTLYWLHLAAAFRRECREVAEHDQFTGVSNLRRLIGGGRRLLATAPERKGFRLWVEPSATVGFAVFIRAVFQEHDLSRWLYFSAICLWVKEGLNLWFGIRQRKRHKDILADAEDAFEDQSVISRASSQKLQATRRKGKIKRTRSFSSSLDGTVE